VEVNSCFSDDDLYTLGQRYYAGLLIPIRASGQTPAVSEHPSRFSADLEEEHIAQNLEDGIRDLHIVKSLVSHRRVPLCMLKFRPRL